MTPKEKAKDIYDKMKGFRVKNSHRKRCALICVDEIIKTIPAKEYGPDMWNNPEREYWMQVRTEIEKL